LITENERLSQFEEAHTIWLEKTEWVQDSAQALDLGRHRADMLRSRIDQLKAENELLRRLVSDTGLELRKASSWICREVEAGTQSATHWAIRLREKAGLIDAAIGKGEQS
jgi:hypothetical protein